MTKDYNSRKQDRNFYRYIHIYVLKKIRENYYVISNIFLFYFYSSNNQGNRGGQSPSINTNNKNSNSISEKSTGLWNNWQTRGKHSELKNKGGEDFLFTYLWPEVALHLK